MRRDDSDPPGQVAALMCRLGRLSVVLTAVVATGAGYALDAPASAASRHVVHSRHTASIRASSKPVRNAARRHREHSYTRARLVRSPARDAVDVHRDVVPLVNTTWDNLSIPLGVQNAIQSAAYESGVDPHLLTAIAWRESRFDPDARNQRSSAKGLLQFTTGTWLQMVRDYGPEHNIGGYAAAIHKNPSGELVVSGKQMRTAILRLRNDPVLSAQLAVENMSQHRAAMQGELGRSVTPADLYLLHVLGPSGAIRFLTAAAKRPNESSVEVASYEVMRNAGLLARDGRPMTVANTYAAAGAMLDTHRERSRPALPPVAQAAHDIPAATPIRVSEAP